MEISSFARTNYYVRFGWHSRIYRCVSYLHPLHPHAGLGNNTSPRRKKPNSRSRNAAKILIYVSLASHKVPYPGRVLVGTLPFRFDQVMRSSARYSLFPMWIVCCACVRWILAEVFNSKQMRGMLCGVVLSEINCNLSIFFSKLQKRKYFHSNNGDWWKIQFDLHLDYWTLEPIGLVQNLLGTGVGILTLVMISAEWELRLISALEFTVPEYVRSGGLLKGTSTGKVRCVNISGAIYLHSSSEVSRKRVRPSWHELQFGLNGNYPSLFQVDPAHPHGR